MSQKREENMKKENRETNKVWATQVQLQCGECHAKQRERVGN